MSAGMSVLCIAEASTRIEAGTLSPVDLVSDCLDRIGAVDDRLHSFVAVCGEAALAEARTASAEIAAGRWRGPLHGIPIGVKDIFDVAGLPTTGQSAGLRNNRPVADATSVALLRNMGAIVLGKTTTWELAIGGPSFDLPWPPARNPWDLSKDPSGSSSGSAAAVAAGLCLAALGSDTGGSIRAPAAWCGVAGLKPTYGLVSRKGVLPLAYSQDHVGPLCWTAHDCAILMDALAGHDPGDPASAAVTLQPMAPHIGDSIEGVRIGVVRHFFERDQPAGAQTLAAMEGSLKVLASLGAHVSDVGLPPLALFGAVGTIISRVEGFAVNGAALRNTPELFGARARLRLMGGAFLTGSDYVNTLRQRAQLIAQWRAVMQSVDVLVFPTAGEPAGRLAEDGDGSPAQSFFNRPANVTGSPALSICNGMSSEGMPLSLQICGRPFEDGLVLRVGHALETVLGRSAQRAPSAAVKETVPPVAPAEPITDGEFANRLRAHRLRVDLSEQAMLAMDVAKLEQAAALVGAGLSWSDEPSNILSLAPRVEL